MSTEKKPEKLTKEELIDLRNWLNKTTDDYEGLISNQLPVPDKIQKAARDTLKILGNIKILLTTVERYEGDGVAMMALALLLFDDGMLLRGCQAGVEEEKKEFAAKILQFPAPKPMFSEED